MILVNINPILQGGFFLPLFLGFFDSVCTYHYTTTAIQSLVHLSNYEDTVRRLRYY